MSTVSPLAPDIELGAALRLPCGALVRNRIFKSAMTEGLADARDRPTDAHVRLYERWSSGGAGILVTGNVMVDRRYLERPGNVVVDDDVPYREFEAWARAGTREGNHLWMQVSHPGRQCTRLVASQPVAPSAVALKLGGLFGRPRALSDPEIVDIVERYGKVAAIAKRTGFTGVQIHGAHGYLCSQFLSPRVNLRTDRWGGSLENRARFLLEVLRSVRRHVGPDFPVSVKLNSSDFQKGGFSLDDSCAVAHWLAEEGLDLLEISGGTYENLRLIGSGRESDDDRRAVGTRKREAYFLQYARAIRQAARVPLVVTGGFRTRSLMRDVLAAGDVDVIGMARPFCTDPDVPRGLLDGALDTARTDERSLQLASGRFGPNSQNAFFRALNAQAQTAWFYAQIIHLSRKEPLDFSLSARAALLSHYRREIGLARARKRT
jgi:2,4-dienoyl-CoA reductase-like NADH-dependent reductase (Old Yellow Enzyme family)